ncbi:unnamed protein product [Allacma fusca]|uniref:Uncharacterized protein n=1 Tax=Allacma fusca TaxID=39272 RepID=A0A8J2KJN2_9HEXA|nr:unnamed protein product [Allacma fusca]
MLRSNRFKWRKVAYEFGEMFKIANLVKLVRKGITPSISEGQLFRRFKSTKKPDEVIGFRPGFLAIHTVRAATYFDFSGL